MKHTHPFLHCAPITGPSRWSRAGYRMLLAAWLFFLAAGVPVAKEIKTVTMAFSSNLISEVNLKDTRLAMEIWSRKLTSRMGFDYRTEVKFFRDYPSLVSAIEKKEVNFVQLSVIEYLGLKDRSLVEPLLISPKDGRLKDPLIMLVHKESRFNSLEQLRNTAMVLERGPRPGELTRFWVETLLLRQKLPPPKLFFKSIETEDTLSRSATKVYFRQADACVISRGTFDTLKELNPQFGRNLRIIIESPPFIYGFFCCVRGNDPEVRRAFMETALKLGSEAEGRQILTLFRVDSIEPFKPDALNECLELYREHEKLRK